MAEEGFLRRWARRKTESRVADGALPDEPPHEGVLAPRPQPTEAAVLQPDAPARPPPSMDDVARLTPDADFSAFVARGVDPAVRRGALKKLFADPHFHAMDGLDVYIDDYTKPSPVSAAMLASLTHAKRVLQPLLDEKEPAPAEGLPESGLPESLPEAPADALPGTPAADAASDDMAIYEQETHVAPDTSHTQETQ
jgi:hypothetical protein